MKSYVGCSIKASIICGFLSIFFLSISARSLIAKDNKSPLIIFHAGSLSIPFLEMEKTFEKLHPEIDVVREAAGSRKCARKITELDKACDIMVSADYTVIEQLLMPEHVDWNISFATNEMVIGYAKESKFSNIINSSNWYKILLKDGVEYAHSDPNADPCGYRSVLIMELAESYYKQNGLFQRLKNGVAKAKVRPKAVELIALIQAAELDYFFEYKSVCVQHDLDYVKLPDEINLSNYKFKSFYNTASIELSGKKPGEKIVKYGEPIIYGITIPKDAPNYDMALKFVRFVLSEKGRNIMEKNGQGAIYPSISNEYNSIPGELKGFVKKPK